MMYSKYSTPQRQERRKTGWSKKLGLIFLSVTTTVLVLLKVATWLNAGVMFSLKDVEIIGNQNTPQSEILSLFELDTTKSIFDIDLMAISSKVKKHPFVHDVQVSRKLPNNLVLKVIEKQPLALINGENLTLIDKHGQFLPELKMFDPVDFPVISKVESSNSDNPELIQILSFLGVVKEQNFPLYSQISEISFSKKVGIYFYMIENSTPVIVGGGDFVGKSEKLIKVIKLIEQTTELSQVKYFDLRFKDQVIVKEFNS